MNTRAAGRRVRWLLALLSLCTLATCPTAQRQCAARQTAREAPALLGYLVERMRLHAVTHHALPDITVGPTPDVGACCKTDDGCAAKPDQWNLAGWRSLGFSIDDRHYFSYQVRKNGDAVVLTAIGDQDCDGVRAVVQVVVALDGDRLVGRWTTTNPLE
jgi:hypothetical protein